MSATRGWWILWRQLGNRLIVAAVVLFAAALVPTQAAGPRQQPPATPTPAPGTSPQRALLNQYCVGCHNESMKASGATPIALDRIDLARVGGDADRWEKVVLKLLNRIGATPFLLAAKAVDLPLMRTLLAAGADPKLANADGTTPLMVAAGVGIWAPGESPGTEEEAIAAVKLLLDLGAGAVTDIDRNGYTAAHGAVLRAGSVPILQLLVDRGARLDVRNGKGWTPLTIAEGIEYTPDIFKRYPETADALRRMMREHGLTVPEPNPTPAVGSSRNRRE